jgi:hypothetical protein
MFNSRLRRAVGASLHCLILRFSEVQEFLGWADSALIPVVTTVNEAAARRISRTFSRLSLTEGPKQTVL